MRKKAWIGLLVLAALLCLGAYTGYRHRVMDRVVGLQPMQIMVDGKRYVHNGGAQLQRPEGAPDGFITQVNDSTDYPDADGEANFGKVGMAYWKVMSSIVVETEKYYVFRPLD